MEREGERGEGRERERIPKDSSLGELQMTWPNVV